MKDKLRIATACNDIENGVFVITLTIPGYSDPRGDSEPDKSVSLSYAETKALVNRLNKVLGMIGPKLVGDDWSVK